MPIKNKLFYWTNNQTVCYNITTHNIIMIYTAAVYVRPHIDTLNAACSVCIVYTVHIFILFRVHRMVAKKIF